MSRDRVHISSLVKNLIQFEVNLFLKELGPNFQKLSPFAALKMGVLAQ